MAGGGVSEIEKIFKGLCRRFNRANVKAERSYYFSLGDHEKWTVAIRRDGCEVHRGENDEADVFFKGPAELFLDVWNGRHDLGPEGLPDRPREEQQAPRAEGLRRRVPEVGAAVARPSAQRSGFIVIGSRSGSTLTLPPGASAASVTGCLGSPLSISPWSPTTSTIIFSGTRWAFATRCTSAAVTARMRSR